MFNSDFYGTTVSITRYKRCSEEVMKDLLENFVPDKDIEVEKLYITSEGVYRISAYWNFPTNHKQILDNGKKSHYNQMICGVATPDSYRYLPREMKVKVHLEKMQEWKWRRIFIKYQKHA